MFAISLQQDILFQLIIHTGSTLTGYIIQLLNASHRGVSAAIETTVAILQTLAPIAIDYLHKSTTNTFLGSTNEQLFLIHLGKRYKCLSMLNEDLN